MSIQKAENAPPPVKVLKKASLACAVCFFLRFNDSQAEASWRSRQTQLTRNYPPPCHSFGSKRRRSPASFAVFNYTLRGGLFIYLFGFFKDQQRVCVFQSLRQKRSSQKSRKVQRPTPGGRRTKTSAPCCPSPRRSSVVSTGHSTKNWLKCYAMTPSYGRVTPSSESHRLLFYPVQKTTDVSASEFHLSQVPMKNRGFIIYFLIYKSKSDESKGTE